MQNLSIIADASLPDLDYWFPAPFKLNLYTTPNDTQFKNPDHAILLCRSTLKVNEHLAGIHHLKIIATASSGTDHIDINFLKKKNITLFDAKGSNARAVADYILATVDYLQQRGFLKHQRAAVVGAGHVGTEVGIRLNMIGFEVIWIDPLKQLSTPGFISADLNDLSTCDLVCVHANLHDTTPFPSQDLFNQELLSTLKPDVVLINAARGGIVNEADLLNTPKTMLYCTDVYNNEPNPNAELIARATICTPHIAGHSVEAKSRAIKQISRQIHKYYGIEPPKNAELIDSDQPEKILTHYNPGVETAQLKAATNKHSMFIQLRQAHVNRHET